MELRYLRYFVTVARRGSFTRAAEELHVAQPAISQQIKALEEELEVMLLLRTKRSVQLTAAGHAFLRDASDILARAEQARVTARRAARGEVGTLAIGCFSSAVAPFLPGLIESYRRSFPAVRVHLYEQTPEQQLHAFAAGKIDLGFTRPLPKAQAAEFVQELVYRDRLMAVLATAHPLATAKEVRLEKLASEDFVLFQRSEAPELVDQMTQLCARAGFAPRVVSESPAMHTVLLAVAAGVGVSLMPGCVRVFAQRGAEFRPVRPASPSIDLMLVRPKGGLAPVAEAFAELVRRQVPTIRTQMAP